MNSVSTPLDGLREAVLSAAGELAGQPPGKFGERGGIVLERPPRADFGDYSTNAALLLAPSVGAPPREVAERLGEELKRRLGASLERFAGSNRLHESFASCFEETDVRALYGDGPMGEQA